VRQNLPIDRSLLDIEGRKIQRAMHWLNHELREILGNRMPHEVFFGARTTLTGIVAI
jgi:IS30 family transposase